MARSCVGLTMFACLPCIVAPQWLQSANSYEKSSIAQDCYEYVVMSSKKSCQTRLTPQLRHKERFAVSGHCHCATAIRGQSVSGSAITTCRRFDCVFGDGVRISKDFPRCCGEKSPARGSGFRGRLRTLDFLRNAAYPASVREMLSRINS